MYIFFKNWTKFQRFVHFCRYFLGAIYAPFPFLGWKVDTSIFIAFIRYVCTFPEVIYWESFRKLKWRKNSFSAITTPRAHNDKIKNIKNITNITKPREHTITTFLENLLKHITTLRARSHNFPRKQKLVYWGWQIWQWWWQGWWWWWWRWQWWWQCWWQWCLR